MPETARAQTSSFDDLAARLKQHETIVVTDTSGQPVTGRLLNLTSASIELALDGAGARSIDRASVGRIAIKDPIRNGAIIGAIAGLIPGVVGGLLINAICINETGACPGAPLLLGALGAAGGAAIGAGVDAMRQKVVYEIRPDLPGEYTPEVFGAVGWDSIAMTEFRNPVRVNGPAHVALGWSMRARSGLGFEFSGTHTVGEKIRPIACVPVESGFLADASLVGTCAGPGHEGMRSQVLGAAKFAYHFPARRVQPHLSAGVVGFESAMVRSYGGVTRSGATFVNEGTNHEAGLALAVGGGVRVPFTRKASLRSELNHYRSDRLNQTRFSIGLSYQL